MSPPNLGSLREFRPFETCYGSVITCRCSPRCHLVYPLSPHPGTAFHTFHGSRTDLDSSTRLSSSGSSVSQGNQVPFL